MYFIRLGRFLNPPSCLTDAGLSRLASKMVTSFVCSDDIVSRLSLGSVRDIRNAALWLCDANERNGDTEGYSVITNRIRRWKAGDGSSDDLHWVSSILHPQLNNFGRIDT